MSDLVPVFFSFYAHIWLSSCWDNHIDFIAKKAQQRLYFLRQLRKFNLPQELLKQFYSDIIESVLCSSITVWFGSATKTDIRRLQRTVRTAERIIGAPLPSLQELYTSRVRKRAKKVTLDPHTQLTLSLYCCPLAGATDHWAPKQPDTRIVFPPGRIPPEQHITPRYCTSVNNCTCTFTVLSMDIFLSVFLLLLLFIIIVYSLIISVFYYIKYMLSALCLYFLYWKLLTPRQIPCVCKHSWQ